MIQQVLHKYLIESLWWSWLWFRVRLALFSVLILSAWGCPMLNGVRVSIEGVRTGRGWASTVRGKLPWCWEWVHASLYTYTCIQSATDKLLDNQACNQLKKHKAITYVSSCFSASLDLDDLTDLSFGSRCRNVMIYVLEHTCLKFWALPLPLGLFV